MRKYALLLLVVTVTACGSLQSVAVSPQQRLFAAYADYIVYGQIVLQAVTDPLTLPETRVALKAVDRRTYKALQIARTAYERGELTEVTLVLAETGLRELRTRLVAEGRLRQ